MQCSHLGSLESDSHSFGQSSILAVTDNDSSRSKTQRKVSREKKRGSHGWKREREETLPSPSSFLAGRRWKTGSNRKHIGERRVPSGGPRREKKHHPLPSSGRPLRSLRSPSFFFRPRRLFFFFPQCGAWSQTTWFLPLLFSLRFVILKYNSKYQSKGRTYILNLFAFAKKKKQKQKTGFGKAMKKVRDASFSRKWRGKAGSAPTLPSPPDHE